MIVKLINEDGIWIPTPKLFFKIFEKTGLKVNSQDDKDIIERRLNEELKKSHDGWDFNIKFSFNIKDGDEYTLCKTRIIKNKNKDDISSGCIVFSSHRKHADREELDFDYEFTKEDL